MEVTTDIKRSDLIRFNLAILPRMRSTYVTILYIAILVFAFIAWDKGFPQSSNDWFAIIAGAVGGGIGRVAHLQDSDGRLGVGDMRFHAISNSGTAVTNCASQSRT